MACLSVVDWVLLDPAAVRVGDVVSADAGGMPTYRVVAVEDGRAWLNDGQHETLWILPVAAFRWKAASAHEVREGASSASV
jgi:hypothetical protein